MISSLLHFMLLHARSNELIVYEVWCCNWNAFINWTRWIERSATLSLLINLIPRCDHITLEFYVDRLLQYLKESFIRWMFFCHLTIFIATWNRRFDQACFRFKFLMYLPALYLLIVDVRPVKTPGENPGVSIKSLPMSG